TRQFLCYSQPENDNNNPPVTAGSSSTRHPVYHGIQLRAGKWVSAIREPNKPSRIWLGTYPTPEMAAAAYDVAALALKARDPTNQSGYGSSSETGTNPHGQYLDHEDVFGMPRMLSDMAEGMLLSPPRINSSPPADGTDYKYSGDDNLWDY
ncbi:ethylene-responsive transcription factor 8, partial [Tanacetum coccineum]